MPPKVRRVPEERLNEIPPDLSHAAEYLNVLLALDRAAVSRVLTFEVVCSGDIEKTPAGTSRDIVGQTVLTPLGILTGLFSRGALLLIGVWNSRTNNFQEFYIGEYLT